MMQSSLPINIRAIPAHNGLHAQWEVRTPDGAPFPKARFYRRNANDPSYSVVYVDAKRFQQLAEQHRAPSFVISDSSRWEHGKRDALITFLDESAKTGAVHMPVVRYYPEVIEVELPLTFFGIPFGRNKTQLIREHVSFVNGRHRSKLLAELNVLAFPVEVAIDCEAGLRDACGWR
ncbi:MAG: hypothetical protein LW865_01950 [Betaproteobacteria bacterium]|jgi:hypothetical protein|nr:hypothetical protein [Rhodocyclaceae bacterium]MCE2722038.1 hypothetical protein [Betaproteobacteria bacterium]